MLLKERLQTDMAAAMREGDNARRDTIRMLMAAVKQIEVDERRTLDDTAVQDVISKQAKQRRESIADAEKAGRADLVAQEQAELTLIEQYLPQMMSREELRTLAAQIIGETVETSTVESEKAPSGTHTTAAKRKIHVIDRIAPFRITTSFDAAT